MYQYTYKNLFLTFNSLKKTFAIFCFFALILSASSLHYFYWVQKIMHQNERFAQMESGEIVEHKTIITIIVKDKKVLPLGYTWEKMGREFSHAGQFFDIISFIQTKDGWKLTAASDEVEKEIVANQSKINDLDKSSDNSKQSNKSKFSLVKLVFDCSNAINFNIYYKSHAKQLNGYYLDPLAWHCMEQISPPPEAVLF